MASRLIAPATSAAPTSWIASDACGAGTCSMRPRSARLEARTSPARSTTLTREPVRSGAYAVDEVTVLQIEREHMEALVMRKPLLLQEIGRTIEERSDEVRRALAAATD